MTEAPTGIAPRRAAKWYERANEASFKPTSGGYVFQAPNPWIFARPRYYLVTEAQKAQLLVGLGRWRFMLVIASLFNAVVCAAPALLMNVWPAIFARPLVSLLHSLGYAGLMLLVVAALTALVVPGLAVAQIRLARTLRAALAGAPLTDERIKMSEQLPGIATSASRIVLAMGLIGGALMIGGGVLMMLDGYLEGHLARSAAPSVPLSLFGAALTAYFIHLLRLRAKQKHAAA